MPICPRCHKFIAEMKLRRHKRRCGKKPIARKVITEENIAPAAL